MLTTWLEQIGTAAADSCEGLRDGKVYRQLLEELFQGPGRIPEGEDDGKTPGDHSCHTHHTHHTRHWPQVTQVTQFDPI